MKVKKIRRERRVIGVGTTEYLYAKNMNFKPFLTTI